jgi:spore maturation protein CgeB
MNIVVVGCFYSEAFALHISETLNIMGNTVFNFDVSVKKIKQQNFLNTQFVKVSNSLFALADNIAFLRNIRLRKLLGLVYSNNIDLIIVCYDYFLPSEINEVKRVTKAKIVLWYPDSIAGFGKSLFMNSDYDALFFKDPYIIHALKDTLKMPIYYLPEAFNPYKHHFSDELIQEISSYTCDITTAGNMHSYRTAFFSNLSEYSIKLWGNSPPSWLENSLITQIYQGRPVYYFEKALAFRNAKVVLNNLLYSEIWGVNVRCFEVAGIGAFQMMDWRPNINHLFEENKEIICFRSISDLKNKLNYWLPRDEERKIIAKSGQKRALSEHTYTHRLNLLLNTVFGIENGFKIPPI